MVVSCFLHEIDRLVHIPRLLLLLDRRNHRRRLYIHNRIHFVSVVDLIDTIAAAGFEAVVGGGGVLVLSGFVHVAVVECCC